jgi:hypothetical protein
MSVPKPEVNPPPRMERADADRYKVFARLATELFPNGIGELCARELNATAEFGYRLGTDALANRVVAGLQDEQRKQVQRAAAEWAAGQPAGTRRQT